jgi:uncharacterized ion transporter superfamily protein YfcC
MLVQRAYFLKNILFLLKSVLAVLLYTSAPVHQYYIINISVVFFSIHVVAGLYAEQDELGFLARDGELSLLQ